MRGGRDWCQPVTGAAGSTSQLHQTRSINFPARAGSACKREHDKGVAAMMNFYFFFFLKCQHPAFPQLSPHGSSRQLSADKSIMGSWKELTLQTWHSDGLLHKQGKGGSAKARARDNMKSINPTYWPYLSPNSITLGYLTQKCRQHSLFYTHMNVFFKYAIHLISAIPPLQRQNPK